MVPAMVTLLQIPRHQAIATSLAVICLLSLVNAIQFYRKRLVDLRVGLTLGVFASVAAFIAGSFGLKASADSLAYGYVVALTIIAIQSFRGEKTMVAKFLARRRSSGGAVIPVVGVVAGAASAFTGVSGGVIMVPFVLASKWVENARVVPTVTVAMFMGSLAGMTSYMISSSRFNFVHFDAALILFAAAAVSSTLGQKYQHRLSARTRGWLLGTILLALIAQTLFQIISK